ncbi:MULTISPECIES: AAA family ATPase [Streptococcus mitis group]|uniref:ATP-binding protein n=2 Tax=Streptococcus mitis group TaxID=3409772 RepID=A0A3B0BMI9_9STRE|nr:MULTISPECIES: AAA family ATPase [Streptococcus]EPR97334.1 ATPase AAA [Streptococcus mitis 18/56]RKN73379.1 ATP-binding protein [Streptococcus chosunense]
MSVSEIIERIRSEYSEIDWLKSRSSFYKITKQGVLVQYDLKELEKKYEKSNFLIINKFAQSAIDWNSDLENYFVITELTDSPKTGNIEITKNNKLTEFENYIGQSYFIIEQDFFTSHFIRVEKDDERYLETLQEIISLSFDDFVEQMSIKNSDWDDYGYKLVLNFTIWEQTFELRVNPKNNLSMDYLKSGEGEYPDEDFCSLGEVAYYEFLKKYLSYKNRQKWFTRSRDLAYNTSVLEKFAIEYSKKSDLHGQTLDFTPPNSEYHSFLYSSFLRTTTLKEIKEVFHPLTVFGYSNSTVHYSGDGKNIIQAVDDRETSINYSFKEDGIDKGALNFKKNRKSKLPMNVYAVVGGNGSGKSYKINQIISEHMAGDKKFSQILHFSLSPFDNIINFDKDGSRKEISDKGKDSDGEIIYEKVGFVSVKYPPILEVLKKAEALALTDVKKYLYQKSSKYLVAENTLKEGFEGKISIKESFSYYIQNLLIDLIASEDKLKMWGDCLNFFTFESWVDDIINAFQDRNISKNDIEKIDTLSSGQATILLYITKLISSINQGSLVIFDEPETFMHPPMVKAFIRAVSELVDNNKAFCLMATHSPVIIQEIPHCNVYKLDSNHELTNIYYKTYGQNLDTLYKNIYGVELQQTGYNSFFNDRKEEIIGEGQNDLEDINLLSSEDCQYLGDEAFLKYLVVKDEIEKVGEVLSKE